MNRINEASADPSPPYDPGQKLPAGPTPLLDPEGRAFVAEWQAHLDAGRIGGNLPISDEARAAMLANERVVMGPRWRGGR